MARCAAPVNCLVTNALYSHTGRQVLIPAGARILGETKPVQAFGETRLAVSFHRLLMPDGRTLPPRSSSSASTRSATPACATRSISTTVDVRRGGGGRPDQRPVAVPRQRRPRQRRWEPNDRHRRRRRRRDVASRAAGHESVSESAADDHDSRGPPREGVPHERPRAAGVHRSRRARVGSEQEDPMFRRAPVARHRAVHDRRARPRAVRRHRPRESGADDADRVPRPAALRGAAGAVPDHPPNGAEAWESGSAIGLRRLPSPRTIQSRWDFGRPWIQALNSGDPTGAAYLSTALPLLRPTTTPADAERSGPTDAASGSTPPSRSPTRSR